MQKWLVGEPSLDEILGDEMMARVVASAGMSREQFRSRLLEVASRLRLGGDRSSGQSEAAAPRRAAFG